MDCFTLGGFPNPQTVTTSTNSCNSFQGQLLSFLSLYLSSGNASSSLVTFKVASKNLLEQVYPNQQITSLQRRQLSSWWLMSAELHENAPLAAPSLPSSRYHPTFSINPRTPPTSPLYSHKLYQCQKRRFSDSYGSVFKGAKEQSI